MEAPPDAASSSAAQTVADIAASLTPARPKMKQPSRARSLLDEIYSSAEIHAPHGYTIMKIADMLQSEHIRNLPAEVKRSSILLALDAAGVKLQEVIGGCRAARLVRSIPSSGFSRKASKN